MRKERIAGHATQKKTRIIRRLGMMHNWNWVVLGRLRNFCTHTLPTASHRRRGGWSLCRFTLVIGRLRRQITVVASVFVAHNLASMVKRLWSFFDCSVSRGRFAERHPAACMGYIGVHDEETRNATVTSGQKD
jgi:hypothetical protein